MPMDDSSGKQPAKRAGVVVYKTHLIFECPFCGQSLVRASRAKAKAVLASSGGKGLAKCPRCGNTCLISLEGINLDETTGTVTGKPSASPQ